MKLSYRIVSALAGLGIAVTPLTGLTIGPRVSDAPAAATIGPRVSDVGTTEQTPFVWY